MMKTFKIFSFCLWLFSCSNTGASPLSLSKKILKNHNLSFVSHKGNGRFESYLSMNVRFEPVVELSKQLLLREKIPLKNRGEAHITVITPVEYFEVLKKKITMAEINQMAKEQKLQKTQFIVKCLGRGQVKLKGRLESTYYVVVDSPQLIRFRQRVQQLYVQRGGKRSHFRPSHYFPHITIGFTSRDLHENDGVIKNEKSCWSELKLF